MVFLIRNLVFDVLASNLSFESRKKLDNSHVISVCRCFSGSHAQKVYNYHGSDLGYFNAQGIELASTPPMLRSLRGAIGQRVRLLTERLVVRAHPGAHVFTPAICYRFFCWNIAPLQIVAALWPPRLPNQSISVPVMYFSLWHYHL